MILNPNIPVMREIILAFAWRDGSQDIFDRIADIIF
jgi:hypothetical protein